jgi:uncharacterized repeat protein (TIGR02543 family)
MSSLRKGLPALVLWAAVIMALVFGMAGCNYFDLGEPIELDEGQPPQTKAGVLTVIGAEDGVSYEAEVYDYPNDDVADAADLTELISVFEMSGTGLDIPGEEALEIELLTPDGEDFTADGDFLVVLKDETDASAPLRYKAAVPFIGGSATVEYDDMETAIRRYTVTFDLNYTGTANPPKPQEIDAGGKATLPTPPTRTGHTFGGWFLDAAWTGAAWDFALNNVTTDLHLYAKWTRNTYKVTFNTGGVEPTPEPLPAFPYDDTIEEPVVTKTGYTLDGWYKEAAKMTKWNFGKDTVKEDITLYGTWTQIKYTVTFNAAGGTPAIIIQSVPYGSAATRPANPTREDYTLDDWYTATDYAAKWTFDSIVTADITLYAKWKPLTLAALLADIAIDATANTDKTYTLPSGSETYTAAITPLTTANSPASVTIDGSNRVITGGTNSITVGEGVSLTLKNITFKTLPLSVAGGGKLVLDNGAVVTENAGAGITVSGTSATAKGTLEMKAGALVKENHASGIVLENNSVLTMTGGEISGNEAKAEVAAYAYGGGVRVNGGTFTMSSGEILNNFADNGGGGVCLEGPGVFTMSGGTISGNIVTTTLAASDFGGGGVVMYGEYATFTMSGGSSIRNNTSNGHSGGVAILGNNGTFTMNGGEIKNNIAAYHGGGMSIFGGGAKFNMTNGEISRNEAGADGGGVKIWQDKNITFEMSGGFIKNNETTWNGGGVYIPNGNTFKMTGGEITDNTAGGYDGPGIGVVAPTINGIIGGNPWIGVNKASGAGPGWIYNNTDLDVSP